MKGKGKTSFLLDKANEDIKTAEGSVVYLDKSTKHMYELSNRIRLINVKDFPVSGAEGLIAFISGIISQDRDLQIMYVDSFLKLVGLEDKDASEMAPILADMEALSEKYGINMVLSISVDGSVIPDDFKKNIIAAL